MNDCVNALEVKQYQPMYSEDVVNLWQECGLVVQQNNPQRDIDTKVYFQPNLLYVGLLDGILVASVMAGYEGHRGWINYLAVKPEYQKKGIGRKMMEHAEVELINLGCPKINLQVRGSNKDVIEFYDRIGYSVEDRVSMGKRII